MSKNIYVGNLSQSTTNESLNAHFSKAGKVVSAEVTMDKNSKRNMGSGYVTMSTEEETAIAIKTLNGTLLDKNRIRVIEAHFLDQKKPSYSFRRR